MIILISILYLVTVQSYASQFYCFNGENLDEVKAYLNPILKKGDTVDFLRSRNCLDLSIGANRAVLFDKWLKRKYHYVKNLPSTSAGHKVSRHGVTPEHCRLELIKKERIASKSIRGNVGKKINARQRTGLQERVSRSEFLVMTGKQVTQRMNDEEVYMTCSQRGSAYQLDISLSGDKGGISTSVTIMSGQEVNIGELVQKMKSNNSELSTRTGVTLDKSSSQGKATYFIKVK
jgi:hypothetical protein